MSFDIQEIIRENSLLLKEVSESIWKNPELGYQEIFAHELLTTTLESFGFSVEKHYVLPTAFRAEYTNGTDGPTVAVICEYDALPKIGHACGHNLIAEIGLAVGIAVKKAMENYSNICGKIVVLGTPAEEGGGGKIRLIEKGVFKDIDAALMAHPQVETKLFPLILESSKMTVTYKTKEGVDPMENPNAVDAAVTCYNNISMLRQSLNSKCRISGVLSQSQWGETRLLYQYRAPTRSETLQLRKQVLACIEAAAKSTDCDFNCDLHEGVNSTNYKGLITNKKLAAVCAKFAKEKGIIFTDGDPRFPVSAVSTDMGNVSHVVPSIMPHYGITSLPNVNHTTGFAQAAISPDAQGPTLDIAVCLAQTVVELMTDIKLLAEVKEEFSLNGEVQHF